jgi:AcrR family transcriptional regulator
MKEVAERARVGERTLYDAFSTKLALFSHTLNVAIVGDELEVAVADRPEVRAAAHEPDPAMALRGHLDYGIDLLERAGDLIMVMSAAADADPDLRTMAERGARATRALHLRFAQSLARRGALATGVDSAAAADVLYALASPHLHQLLRRHRRWSVRRYRTWLVDTASSQILA